jgi:glycosyltransferase involved in cell wall biosynthesis
MCGIAAVFNHVELNPVDRDELIRMFAPFRMGRGVEKGGEHQHREEEGRGDAISARYLSDEMKASTLAAADVFDLPSASENFGIAAAESLAVGTPAIVSEEVGLSMTSGIMMLV